MNGSRGGGCLVHATVPQQSFQLWRAAMLQLRAVIGEEERLLEAAMDSPPEVQLRMAMRLFLQISWRHPALGPGLGSRCSR